MSTSAITLDYTNSALLHRNTNKRWIIVLTLGLLLVASFVLVAASSAKVDSSSNAASHVIAISNPIAPEAAIQTSSKAIVTPAPDPVVIAIQAPMPPSDH